MKQGDNDDTQVGPRQKENTVILEPHLSSTISFIFLTIDLFNIFCHFYFHNLIRRMILRKDCNKTNVSIIQNLLSCYSMIVPLTFSVVFVYLNVVLQYIYPPSEIFGEWLCFVYEYFAHSTGLYLGTFSLFTAGMKYWFIVFNAKARLYGEEKVKKWFFDITFGRSSRNSCF